jgi:hypothetical protein
MSDNAKNVTQTDWGYELYWAKKENYASKILVFNKPGKTPFYFQLKTEKSWFINEGKFLVRWIDKTGKIFQTELEDGAVIECETARPYSLECTSGKGSITESSNGYYEDDVYVVVGVENF